MSREARIKRAKACTTISRLGKLPVISLERKKYITKYMHVNTFARTCISSIHSHYLSIILFIYLSISISLSVCAYRCKYFEKDRQND